MNAKTFDRKLNFYINNNILTADSIQIIIERDKNSLISNVEIKDLLKNNIQKIVMNTLQGYKLEMIEYLYKFSYLKTEVENILPEIITEFDYYDIKSTLENELAPKAIEAINLKINDFINKDKESVLFDINSRNSNVLTPENKLILNNYFNKNKRKLAKIITDDSEIYFHKMDAKEYNAFLDMVSILIDELMLHGNINYSDIKYLGKGSYSKVYEIGDKVLKLGAERGTYQIGNDKRLLQPLLRINLRDSFKINGTIEITNVVDTNIKLSEKEFYKLFKEMRSRGIFYTDLRMDNLGYLKNDNTYNWNENLDNNPTIRGLDRSLNDDEILKKGEVVVIDSDFFYNAELVKKIDYGNSKIRYYEKKYQKELTEEQTKKI